MATLQRIRNRTGLLLTVIGVAMLAFVLGDLSSFFGPDEIAVEYAGKVLGKDVSLQDYELKVSERKNIWRSNNPQSQLTQTIEGQLRSSVWDQHVQELVMNNEYLKLGIDISDEEWLDRISGGNVHPEIIKLFPNLLDTATGQFNGQEVLNYRDNLDQVDTTGGAKAQWLSLEKGLLDLIKNEKYNSLITKAMYVTSQEAKVKSNEREQYVTFNYVAIPLTSVSDSIVKPTESEIKTYYTKYKSNYKQNASKDVDFVVFTVTPSAEDDVSYKSEIEDLKSKFSIDDDYEWLRSNSDNTTARFTFTTKKQLLELEPNWTELFASEEGTVIGPYQASQGVYRIAKLAVSQNRPDSVEARHMLIKPTQTMNLDSAQTRIYAIKAQVEAGADFGFLAQKNSDDPGSAIKGGDLGWFSEGAMVDEFNEACFTSKRGDLSVVTSQFGVHLIEVTKTSKTVRKVKIAFIDRNVEPSTQTFNTYYSQAAQFAGKILNEGIAFDSLVVEQNLVKRSDSKVTADKQSIVGLPNSREMVRWMNTAEQGKVSEVF